jgi:cytochrome c553
VDDHEEVHLGESMNVLSRRFSAVWFAGKAGNAEMVDYQIHEIEELVEELKPAAPHENGIDVVERLETDILTGLEDVEKAVDASDPQAFEASYRRVMNSCGGCHHNTGHGFIKPKIPDYNPYPNLDLSGRD